jgi:lipopolysaccharide export system protein LptA
LADQLDYDASTRRAVLLGQARYQAEKLRLNAERIDLLLDEHQAVQELIAGGAVRLEVGKNVGICDRLEWTGGEAGVAWLIGSDSFASLTSPDAPPLRGQRLRYDLASGSFTAEGGVGKTVLDKDPSPPPTSP